MEEISVIYYDEQSHEIITGHKNGSICLWNWLELKLLFLREKKVDNRKNLLISELLAINYLSLLIFNEVRNQFTDFQYIVFLS